MRMLSILAIFLCFGFVATAQIAEESEFETTSENSEELITPIDGIVERKLMQDRMVLPYMPTRESDLFWEKYLWGIIDVREKINQPFANSQYSFFSAMVDGIKNGDITAYSADTTEFRQPLSAEEVKDLLFKTIKVPYTDPETWEQTFKEVRQDLDYSTIEKFRIKEVWYFDKEISQMKVRILGIAPVQNVQAGDGELEEAVTVEVPMFWIYWPDARHYFAGKKVYLPGNDASVISWDDLMEMRYFNYYVYKESNVRNFRIKEYPSMQGDTPEIKLRRMLASKKIKDEIFNYEHDLWSY